MYPNSLADIVKALMPEAKSFVVNETKGTNKEGKKKLTKAIEQNRIETNSFPDVDIDLLDFDWCSIDMDRNWWWQMQALPFLGWFAQSYQQFDAHEQKRMVDYCLKALDVWLAQELTAETSPLRWHDHATAFRLTNLVNWLVVVSSSRELIQQVLDAEPNINFAKVINQHVVWLTEDKNYSMHTNHGFDQAQAVYALALYVDAAYWQCELLVARRRLVGEIRFAFTDEGVHKENSPGYHLFMMRRLKKLERLESVGDKAVGPEAKRIQEGAERFLKAITLPDGTLPMVGDTRGGQAGKRVELTSEPTVYDFSESGYVIVKGSYKKLPYYLLVKNCHFSSYHRHDDDLLMYFWFDGLSLLSDGGLGSHNEKEPERIELRSYRSHCVPYLNVNACRQPNKLKNEPALEVSGTLISGTSWMYGAELRRVIDFSEIRNGMLLMKDRVIDRGGAQEFGVNFISELDFQVAGADESKVYLCRDGLSLASLSVGKWSKVSLGQRVKSEKYGVYEHAAGLDVSAGQCDEVVTLFELI